MGFIGLLAPLLGLLLILWILLGGPARQRERKQERRRKGGRTAKDRSFVGLPSRDREWRPGGLLLVVTVVQLAQVVADAGEAGPGNPALSSAVVLSGIVAVGFRYRPDVVSAGIGVLGVVALVLGRFGAINCGQPPTQLQNMVWLAAVALMLVAVVGLRLFVAPIASAARVPARLVRPFWTSVGGAKRAGYVGQAALVTFGVLDLLDLLLRPDAFAVLDERIASMAAVMAITAAAVAILAVGLALVPEFTTSVTGAAVAAANLWFLGVVERCDNAQTILVVAGAFALIALLARGLR